jgi:hypothetical protein
LSECISGYIGCGRECLNIERLTPVVSDDFNGGVLEPAPLPQSAGGQPNPYALGKDLPSGQQSKSELKQEIGSPAATEADNGCARIKAPTRQPVRTAAGRRQAANMISILMAAIVSLAVALIGAAVWLATKRPAPQMQTKAAIAPAAKPAQIQARKSSPGAQGARITPLSSPAVAQPARPAHTASQEAIPHVVPVIKPGQTVPTVRPVRHQPAKIHGDQPVEPAAAEPPHDSEPDQMGIWYRFSEGERAR